ncbi:MAG: hypothetical protein Ct9H300mP29_4700 [Candidatus Neomarinimicrobiota bacterium]|nr:MAG: hypothetical protein Ct9H300mP29_4700 [Candidatus Neomarinimicrobiota bacterium]
MILLKGEFIFPNKSFNENPRNQNYSKQLSIKIKESDMRKFSQVLMLILLPVFVIAQHTVSGTVTDANTGDALPGANVV